MFYRNITSAITRIGTTAVATVTALALATTTAFAGEIGNNNIAFFIVYECLSGFSGLSSRRLRRNFCYTDFNILNAIFNIKRCLTNSSL